MRYHRAPSKPFGDETVQIRSEESRAERVRLRRDATESCTVSLIVEFVEANYASRISLREVADALGYSRAYLTCMFRKRVGMPVTAWIIQRRISEAQRLLHESGATVDEICGRVGFNDLCYFTRQFTRHVGSTPGRYRGMPHHDAMAISWSPVRRTLS
jgi:AraC-like DNA-binding protein